MRFRDLKKFILFGFTALVLGAFSNVPALADDDIETLTQSNVKAFIENTTDVTTGNSKGLSPEKIKAYLNKHLEKDARFKSVLKYNIPGMPPHQTSLALDKAEFMDSVNKGAEAVEGYETLVEIKDIKIASSGEKAFVKTRSTEHATLPVPTETGDVENVPMEGVSDCTQILSLNDGVIQMYSANCNTDIQFLEY